MVCLVALICEKSISVSILNPPANITISNIKEKSAILKFKNTNRVAVSYFRVYSNGKFLQQLKGIRAGASATVTLVKLKGSTNYSLKIYAYNSKNQKSKASRTINFKTPNFWDVCTAVQPCKAGELADCDSDNTCEAGSYCHQNVGRKYGLNSGADICEILREVLYENAEDRKTTGWVVYDTNPSGAKISNVYDSSKRSRVIKLSGHRTYNGYMLGGYSTTHRSNWKNTQLKKIEWKMRYNENYYIFVSLQTTKGHRYLRYNAFDRTTGTKRGKYLNYGLGKNTRINRWVTINRDLSKDLKRLESDNKIIEVQGFLVRGSGYIDDIKLKK